MVQPKFNTNDLERRPEFAVQQPQPVQQAQQAQQLQQPQAGPSRPTAPAPNCARPTGPVVPPAPPSPLRTLQEVETSDITMNEAFDGEFLDMGGESFFDIVDEGGAAAQDNAYVSPDIALDGRGLMYTGRQATCCRPNPR